MQRDVRGGKTHRDSVDRDRGEADIGGGEKGGSNLMHGSLIINRYI